MPYSLSLSLSFSLDTEVSSDSNSVKPRRTARIREETSLSQVSLKEEPFLLSQASLKEEPFLLSQASFKEQFLFLSQEKQVSLEDLESLGDTSPLEAYSEVSHCHHPDSGEDSIVMAARRVPSFSPTPRPRKINSSLSRSRSCDQLADEKVNTSMISLQPTYTAVVKKVSGDRHLVFL